ncbi:ankyrin [Artomyces pyxidatus]|uniref:Ankyrin n=1 Tax=Artomyces pyxidatus TaxID=48021 RepID=A0ACB8TFH6_9AGAM|nr:ankyrin [Artomyces pyxidatus]
MLQTTSHGSPSSRNTPFLAAVIRGDENHVRSTLASGEDVNATDAAGRSTVACAISGESWETADASDASFMTPGRLNVLQMLVQHQHVSLYTLNAPQDAMNGVTPLGMAAWLNAPKAVRIMLEDSAGAVSVNGIDAHRATALMYAARDGNLEVAHCLLTHGARPDFRDRNHRSSIQYALPHRQLLSLCEGELRTLRFRELKTGNNRNLWPGALAVLDDASSLGKRHHSETLHDNLTSTTTIIKTIISADNVALQSLLFTPPLDTSDTHVLVNQPDGDGWSPIHYCTSLRQPTVETIDLLFLAGADVSLFSKLGNSTPLHCLARRKRGPDSLRDHVTNALLYRFVLHLVRDLGAPLDALDNDRETCLHIAAEHGDSAEVLRALLECDGDHAVSEIRNSRGLNPLEVAKPEFRAVFGIHGEDQRPPSSASLVTVRPLHHASSFPSLHSSSSSLALHNITQAPSPPPPAVQDFDVYSTFERFLNNVRLISHELPDNLEIPASDIDLDHFDHLVHESEASSQSALRQLRSRLEETRDGLLAARDTWAITDALLDSTAQAVEDKLLQRRVELDDRADFIGRSRSGTTVSADSQLTAVSNDAVSNDDAKSAVVPGAQLSRPFEQQVNDALLAVWPSWLDPEATTQNSYQGTVSAGGSGLARSFGRLKSYKSMSDLRRLSPTPELETEVASNAVPTRRVRADTLTGVVRNPETCMSPASGKETEKGNGARLKAWLRKKLLPERTPKPSPPPSSPEPRLSLSTLCEENEVPGKAEKEEQEAYAERTAQHLSYRALAAAGKDLARIDESMSNADKLIASAYRTIARAERIAGRILQARRSLINEHRSARTLDAALEAIITWDSKDSLADRGPALKLLIPEFPHTTSVSSSVSSNVSPKSMLSPPLYDSDDADTRALEYLVMHKIEARLDAASEEVERVETWLSIVQEVLECAQKRAGIQP